VPVPHTGAAPAVIALRGGHIESVVLAAKLGILQAYATPEQQAAEIREEFRRVTEMVKKTGLTK
jgi:tripartite-type tricarboxylate transporter receptor subunit TctC